MDGLRYEEMQNLLNVDVASFLFFFFVGAVVVDGARTAWRKHHDICPASQAAVSNHIPLALPQFLLWKPGFAKCAILYR